LAHLDLHAQSHAVAGLHGLSRRLVQSRIDKALSDLAELRCAILGLCASRQQQGAQTPCRSQALRGAKARR
jgi:hypothetical protein